MTLRSSKVNIITIPVTQGAPWYQLRLRPLGNTCSLSPPSACPHSVLRTVRESDFTFTFPYPISHYHPPNHCHVRRSLFSQQYYLPSRVQPPGLSIAFDVYIPYRPGRCAARIASPPLSLLGCQSVRSPFEPRLPEAVVTCQCPITLHYALYRIRTFLRSRNRDLSLRCAVPNPATRCDIQQFTA